MWEVSVTQFTFVTFLTPKLITARATARVDITLLRRRTEGVTAACLTAGGDVMTPVVGCTSITSLSYGVGRTDTLTCVSITVVSHMGTLAWCTASLLEAEMSRSAAVTLLSRDTGLTATLTALITVKGL